MPSGWPCRDRDEDRLDPRDRREAPCVLRGTVASLQASLSALADSGTRAEMAAMAAARGASLTWQASAAAHAGLFREVLDG